MCDVFGIEFEERGSVLDISRNNRKSFSLPQHGRTVHSLAKVLALYRVNLRYVSPPGLEMPPEIKSQVAAAGIRQETFNTLADAIADSDVIYMTRIQK